MKRILDDMSHMVKLVARPMSPRPTPIREIVEEVILKYNNAIEEGGVKVTVPDDLPTLNVDSDKIREAIGALFSNALFFTDQPKGQRQIRIEYTGEGSQHRFCLRDNGTGIDPKYAPQVFDLGGVSKLDKARGGGPGYGLYMAKRIFESHGGTLSVDTKLGEGSSFCFTISS